MPSFAYRPNEYMNLLKFSQKKRLLVEGKDDKKFFKLLLDEFYRQSNISLTHNKIIIDSAEDLIEFNNYSTNNVRIKNREKVETICRKVENESYSHRLVGFVDREFREFSINETIHDNLNFHKIQGRLVWSRGHSIENYFFDFSVLRESLRDLSDTEWFSEALDLFEKLIESTMRLACAASLTGNEIGNHGNFNLIKKSINWEIMEVSDSRVMIFLDKWEKSIRDKKTNPNLAQKIVARYQYWLKIIDSVNLQDIKWICHGHIGIAVIWSVYTSCVYNTCYRYISGITQEEKHKIAQREAAKIQSIGESNRTHSCASWWVRKAIVNDCDYPIDVLMMLGIIEVL